MPGNGAVGANYGDLLVTSLLVLGAVCIAAFIAVRFFGRILATGRARGTHLLDVVARVPLEPRRSLYVVEVAGKTLLVGTSEMGLSVLSELDGAEVKARVAKQQSFADLVRTAWRKRKGLTPAAAAARAESHADVPAETRGDRGSRDVAALDDARPNVSAETCGDRGSRDVAALDDARPNVSAETRGDRGSRDVAALDDARPNVSAETSRESGSTTNATVRSRSAEPTS